MRVGVVRRLLVFTLVSVVVAGAEFGFPRRLDARGFADTRGGLGGQVIRVTNLDAEGTGSLRAAVMAEGPRIIVFEVGGVLDLKKASLVVSEPFVTIAGQTAPSPGITMIRGTLTVVTHDVVIQHLRVRPGDAGEPKRSGWEPDGISVAGGEAHNVVIDHCSVTWAVDENLSASGARTEGPQATAHRVTFSHCIIAEGLNHASHAKGRHSKGSLIHDFCQDIAIIGNLYAHNVRRNPYFKAHTTGVIVNNLIYNPGSAAIQLGYPESEWKNAPMGPVNCKVSIVGNVLLHGQDTRWTLALVAAKGDAYLEDNSAFFRNGKPARVASGGINILQEKPVWPDELRPLPSTDVLAYVLHHAGARPRDRDDTDTRIIADVIAREGRVIDSQEQAGGYPSATTTRRVLTIPADSVQPWLEQMAMLLEE